MASIAENLQTILDIKNDIKSAIIAKGVSVADSDSFATYPSKIESIESGGTGGTTSALDFSLIGYNTDLSAELNAKYNDEIAYSKTILDNWNPSTTNAQGKFQDDTKLVYCPLLDTSNVTSMYGMFQSCSNLTTIPLLDSSKVTTMYQMFKSCESLTTIPQLDTSKVTNMYSLFSGCTKLTTIPHLDTSKVTNMSSMFFVCESLQSIPLLDTSNVTEMSYMFYDCKSLHTIPLFNTSNVTNMTQMFSGCSSLQYIPQLDTSKVTNFKQFIDITKLQSLPLLDMGSVSSSSNINNFFGYSTSNNTTLTDVGGFKNLKVNWTDNYGVKRLANLTYESVMNIINNLYDFRSNGDTSTTRTIALNANSKALLSESDIAIATNKGWIIS